MLRPLRGLLDPLAEMRWALEERLGSSLHTAGRRAGRTLDLPGHSYSLLSWGRNWSEMNRWS